MWRYNNPDELYHWGVLGMRWGHRKQKYRESKDYRRAKAIQRKSVKAMSNKELDMVNNRLTKEKNYRANRVDKYLKTAVVIGTVATVLGNMDKIYENSSNLIKHSKKLINNGKGIVNKFIHKN